MHSTENRRAAIIEASAGFAAGTAATLLVHPLDLLKLRLQGELLI
jgi:hypothetical protein